MANAQPKVKAYVSNFTFHLGPIHAHGKMIGVRKTKAPDEAGKYVLCTPEGEPVKPVYVNANNTDEQFVVADLHRAKRLDDGTLQLVGTKADVDALKKSDLPKDVINLTVHRAADVDSALFASDNNAYVFEPDMSDPVNVQFYASLLEAARGNEYALVGMCNFHNNEGLFRLTVWRDRLVLQKMLYPDELNDHQPLDLPGLPTQAVKKVRQVVANLAAPFDASQYTDTAKAKLAEMEIALLSGDKVVAPKKAVATAAATFDLMSALDSALDEEPAPKKSPRKKVSA